MDHLKKFWEDEMRDMREALRNGGFELTYHAEKERMEERNITLLEMAEVILTGQIYEGYDQGQYPHSRNKAPVRAVCGVTSSGRLITVIVSIESRTKFKVITTHEGVSYRFKEKEQTFFSNVSV